MDFGWIYIDVSRIYYFVIILSPESVTFGFNGFNGFNGLYGSRYILIIYLDNTHLPRVNGPV